MKVSKFLGSQKVLNELARMDFKVVAYAMRDFSRMQDLADHLAWAYNAEDVKSGKMREELEYAYESDMKLQKEKADKEAHFKAAIEYVKENHRFSDWEISQELLQMDSDRSPISEKFKKRISDLMDDFSKDNGLDEDWWRDEKTEEDIFWAMTE